MNNNVALTADPQTLLKTHYIKLYQIKQWLIDYRRDYECTTKDALHILLSITEFKDEEVNIINQYIKECTDREEL